MKMRPKRSSATETEPIEEIFGSSGQVKSPSKPKSRRSSIQSLQNTFHTTFSSLKIRRRLVKYGFVMKMTKFTRSEFV